MDFAHMIFRVALSGDATSLSQVLHENPDLVNLPDFDGNMPLHFAAMSGSSECVRICISVLQTREDLDCAVEVQRKNFMGQDALTLAVEKSDYESFSLLLNAGAETDYRLMDSVPPLVAALGQGNVKLTADVLDALEINFVRSRHDGYWLSALHTDLSISLAYFKLLKAHAVPFTLDDFEEICATVLEKEPAVKGIEEFLTFLGSDAVERWSIHQEEVTQYLLRISSYFLRKLVPFSQNFSCIHRLQNLCLYVPPSSTRAWLKVISQWGFPKIYLTKPNVQKRLIWTLADIGGSSKRIVSNECLLPLVLYFAVLAVRFPFPDWINWWHQVCSEGNFCERQLKLGTLLELQSTRESKPVFEFFWHNIFTFVISRAVLYTDAKLFSLTDIQNSMDCFLHHAFHECSTLKPLTPRNHEKLIILLLSYFPASSGIPGHELFMYVICRHFLPSLSDNEEADDNNCTDVSSSVIMTATVHVLNHYPLLNLFVNFSARLGLKFLSNLQDWPRFMSTDDKTRLLSMLISCYVEASQLIILPKSVAQLLPLTLVDRHNYLDGSMHNWLDEWLSEPRSLLLWSKITVRACLRHSIRHCNSPKQPIDELIRSLPIPLALQQYVAKNEYV